jgi:hypothetical protein
MKLLSTKAHGMLDYLMSLVVILSPWLFQFASGGPETTVPVVLGITAILYSLITNYEYSIATVIPFGTHLVLDVLSAILLAASPWLFGFNDIVFLPHLILGILELGAVMMSRRYAGEPGHRAHHVQ